MKPSGARARWCAEASRHGASHHQARRITRHGASPGTAHHQARRITRHGASPGTAQAWRVTTLSDGGRNVSRYWCQICPYMRTLRTLSLCEDMMWGGVAAFTCRDNMLLRATHCVLRLVYSWHCVPLSNLER